MQSQGYQIKVSKEGRSVTPYIFTALVRPKRGFEESDPAPLYPTFQQGNVYAKNLSFCNNSVGVHICKHTNQTTGTRNVLVYMYVNLK